ncbi:hypothetical protein PIROE2DRAFT_64209 [Piromyces sp. E2]|nr:hypothetical protein PIROE2DRAFT_64209 [Piromyces sp. E2]|eukprot:OUM58748.1 hypothetical protein PIROE2DRAFT_64209 [Piromyces sp. E2]
MKNSFNEIFKTNNYENLDNTNKNNIENLINDVLNNQDLIKELLKSSNVNNPSLFNDQYTKSFYIYPYNKHGYNNLANRLMRYMNFIPNVNLPTNHNLNSYNDNYYSGSTTNINYLQKPNAVIPSNHLRDIFSLCRNDKICQSHFQNLNSRKLEFSIFWSKIPENGNDIRRYHLILNDKQHNKLIHAMTFKEDNNNSLVKDNNYITKNIHYYKPIPISNSYVTAHATLLYILMNQNDMIRKMLNIYTLSSTITNNNVNIDDNRLNEFIANENIDTILSDVIDKYSNLNQLDLSNNQKQRLIGEIYSTFYSLYKNNINNPFDRNKIINSLDQKLKIESDNNIIQQNIFYFDLFKEALSDNPNFTTDEIDQLCNTIKNYILKSNGNSISETDNEIVTIRQVLRNPGTRINDNTVRDILNKVLNHDSNTFNNLFFNDFDKISFTNNNKKTIESLNNYFGREYVNIKSKDNNGYAKDKSYESLIKSGYIFRDPTNYNNIYIPQVNGINLGNYVTKYSVKGYQYKNPNTNKIENDKINTNGIGKYIQGNDRNGENAMTNVINALTDHQKNTNLPNQLDELNDYLKKLREYNSDKDINNKKKSIQYFNNENHWVNDILQFKIIDIFKSAEEDYSKCREILLNKLNNLNNLSQQDKNILIDDITNNYIVQYNFLPGVDELKKGINLKDIFIQNNSANPIHDPRYVNLRNTIENIINNNNINDINKIKNYIANSYKQAAYTMERANHVINNLNNFQGEPTNYSSKQQLNFIQTHNNDADSEAIKYNNRMKNYNHNHINMFDNVACKELNGNKFFNYNKLTNNFAAEQFINYNNNKTPNKELFGKMLLGKTSDNVFHHIYAPNKNGKINGITVEENHMLPTDNAFSLRNSIGNHLNDGTCGRGRLNKRQESGNACKITSNIFLDKDLNSYTLGILKLFKDKNIDSNILSHYNNLNDIFNIKYLHDNAETIGELWKELANDYIKNINKFTLNESETFITTFNLALNSYKEMISKLEYNDIKFIDNINSDTIELMLIYHEKAHGKYIEKYGEIENEDNEIVITNSDYYEDSQSKYSKEKLINSVDNIVSIVNQNEGNHMYGIGTIYNEDHISSEIDHKSIASDSINLNDAIDKLCEKINSLDESYNNELTKIFNDINELHSINNNEYRINNELSVNSEIVHKLHNSLAKKLGIQISLDENIPKSENVLRITELERFENSDIINIINDDTISVENKKYIFKGLENEIKNSEGNTLNIELYNTINSIKEVIEDKAKQIKEFSSH